MQASINASEVLMRNPIREDLSSKTAEFLKHNKITKVGTLTNQKDSRQQFNSTIAVAPDKRAERAKEKEAIDLAIKELAEIEIIGVKLRRSSNEVAKLLRQRGFKLQGPSVKRIADSLGIELSK